MRLRLITRPLHIFWPQEPSAHFLWLGALLTGLNKSLLRRARLGSCDIELHSAAWTQTLQSFMQLPLSQHPKSSAIQRSDECRLLYLASEEYQSHVPTSPWGPFGETAMNDTEIDVRLHADCNGHSLGYKSWSWNRNEGNNYVHTTTLNSASVGAPNATSYAPCLEATMDSSNNNEDAITPFEAFDLEDDDASFHATVNVFMWPRRDGFPAAEQDIRHHEWLCEVLDQEAEEAYESCSD
ncbi:hypothetical protein EDB81DRAFT_35938 [Dactylonectria macrodidyma]|uniref:Uncharacterized protein n=1 Tax=Dactylonectria macrodidyma TaxID=307937 RepID=A0A9P9FTG5_9HYPO|nr:hypothetical protein EDB81DRAFT_35938 [Dactylonectria macrodidyma]